MVLDVSKFDNQYLYKNSYVVLGQGVSALRVTMDKSDPSTPLTTLTATPQAVTASYADVGASPLIATSGYSKLLLYLKRNVNDSENVNLKALISDDASETTLYEIETNGTKSLWTTSASDGNTVYEFSLDGVDYIKLQVIAGTVGATAGTIDVKYKLV